MKKITLMLAAVAISAAFTSCDKTNPQVEEKSSPKTPVSTELKIAYVEVDSIMTQYTYCVETKKKLEEQAKKGSDNLAVKEKELNAAGQKFQEDVQANRISSQAEGERRQAALQQQAANLQQLQNVLAGELQKQQEDFNVALHDSIQNYLKVYNKDKKFSYILTKSGDNILYADPAYDITAEVIAGLNKAYKPGKTAPAKETKEEPAKEEKK